MAPRILPSAKISIKKYMDSPGPWGLALECLALALTAALAWSAINARHSYVFWDAPMGEHTELSLAAALHMETRIQDGVNPRAIGLVFHPGAPFYVASWVAYRLGAVEFPPGVDGMAFTLQRPEAFWAARLKVALAVGISAWVTLWIFLRPMGLGAACAGLGLYLSFFHCWLSGLTELTPESFALPLMAAFFLAFRRALRDEKPHRPATLAAGAAAGVLYSLKLPYGVFFFAGSGAIMVFHMLAKRGDEGLLPRALADFFIGAGAVVFVVLPLVIGPGNFMALMANHLRVATHSGHYGGGQLGLPAATSMMANVRELSGFYPWAFPVAALYAVAAFSMAANRKGEKPGDLALAACFTLSLAGLLFAVISHYQTHYIIMLAALSALAGGAAVHQALRRLAPAPGMAMHAAMAAAMLALALGGYRDIQAVHEGFRARLDKGYADFAAIKGKLLGENDLMVWAHGTGGRPFILTETMQFAGLLSSKRLEPVRKEMMERGEAATLAGLYLPQEPTGRSIRYIVSPKMYFKPEGDLAMQGPMCVPYENGDVVTNLSTVTLVEKARPVPPEEYMDLARCGKEKWSF